MEIYESIIDFFGIVPLTSAATFVDILNYIISIGVGVFIVAFLIRSLFLCCVIPFDKWD